MAGEDGRQSTTKCPAAESARGLREQRLLRRAQFRSLDGLPSRRGLSEHGGETSATRTEPLVERSSDLFDFEGLNDIADLDIVKILDADAALVALSHFAHVVLEAA